MRIPVYLLLFATAVAPAAAVTVTMSPMHSFGGGDGWRAPREVLPGDSAGTAGGTGYTYLGTTGLERGLSYNPATGNLILVSQTTAGNGLRILNGTTGHDSGSLNRGNVVVPGQGHVNKVDIRWDGSIFVSSLSVSQTAPFRVYHWTDEGAPQPALLVQQRYPGVSMGDSFAVHPHPYPNEVQMAAAGSTPIAGSGFLAFQGHLIFQPTTLTGTVMSPIPGTTFASNDYGASLTYWPERSILFGTQGGPVRMTLYSSFSAALMTSIPLGATENLIDFAMIGGTPVLAAMDTVTSMVSVYDISIPENPVLLASQHNTSGTPGSNPLEGGSVTWGDITETSATLYAMSTNQGIQAFNIAIVPEPESAALACGALLASLRRRRDCRRAFPAPASVTLLIKA